MSPLKIVLVGLGSMGKKHAILLGEMEAYFSLVATIDSHSDGLDIKIPHFKSFDDFFSANIHAHLAVIATPNAFHAAHAEIFLKKHFHVLIEKPATLSFGDLERILESYPNSRKFSVLQLRFSPIIKRIKNLIDSKEFSPFLVSIECFWNRNDAYYTNSKWHGKKDLDGGVIFTQFSHFIDILHYLFNDEIELIHHEKRNFAHQHTLEFADTGVFSFRQPFGIGNMTYTIATHPKNYDSHITMVAPNGTIRIGGQYMNELRYFTLETVSGNIDKHEPTDFLKDLYREVYNSIQSGADSIVNLERVRSGIRFMELLSN